MTAPRVGLALASLVAAAALAGCATGAGARVANFALEPDGIGWNVGETARFTLTLQPSVFKKSPEYVIDRDLAIAEVELDRRGVGLGGDYRTRDANAVSLRLLVNGTHVDEARLDASNSTVTVTLKLPDKLDDAEYTLGLHLFRVGWVSSSPFRVNVP